MEKTPQRIWISADHGLAVVYFLQTYVVPTLLKAGIEVVVLTDDGLVERIAQRFGQPGLTVEGLRLKQARQYFDTHAHSLQYWVHFLRWMGGGNKVNTWAIDSHWRQMKVESSRRARLILPLIQAMISLLRNSRRARQNLVRYQQRFNPQIYRDLFEKYPPGLVVASTPGWRFDRYLLREAAQRGVPTASVIVGWDNPSSYRLPGAAVDWITCWSQIQKDELVYGADWDPKRVHIGGIPSYDGYFRKEWLMPRQEYFQLHNLDPRRKLISYACSFVTFSPNIANIQALARLVSSEALSEPSQLLIRLHPNHFLKDSLFEQEARQVRKLAEELPHVHLVEPVPLGGELGYYSGEDMPEKSSMMAQSDVFLTVYSTMVVETALHDRPIIGACIDVPGGWNTPGKFSLSLKEIGEWPTHQRFRRSGAGQVAYDEEGLRDAINRALQNPQAEKEQRRKFILDECTFDDGSAGLRTGEFLASIIGKRPSGGIL